MNGRARFCLSEVSKAPLLNGARESVVERTARCRHIPGATIQSEWDVTFVMAAKIV